MPIAITGDGKVITQGGLPSCACCGGWCECDPYFTVLSIYLDAGSFQMCLTFTGNSCDGFTNTDLGDMVLYWDGTEWLMDILDQTGLQAVDACPYPLGSSTPTVSSLTDRCPDFIGTIFYYDGTNGPTCFTILDTAPC